MKQYIDVIFFENLVFSILVIYQVNIFTKQSIKKINLILSSTISATYSVISVIFSNTIIDVILIRILVINVIIYIAFLPKQLPKYLKLLGYFYTISFCYVGIIVFLATFFKINISSSIFKAMIYTLAFVISYLCNKHMWKMWKSKIKKDELVYKVKIKLKNNKEMSFNAFIDTGNNLRYFNSAMDVIILDKNLETKFKSYFINHELSVELNIQTINDENKLTGYIVSNVEVTNKDNKFLFKKAIIVFTNRVFSKDNIYQALMSYDTYIEKLQGVML